MDWVKLPKKNSTIAPVDTPKGIVIPYCMLMVLCAILFALSGCRQDYSLSPPADSEKVSVTVRLQKELALRTLQVMYRSASCKRASRGASGQRLEEDGFHSIDMPLERQGQSDLYQANLPMDGGSLPLAFEQCGFWRYLWQADLFWRACNVGGRRRSVSQI